MPNDSEEGQTPSTDFQKSLLDDSISVIEQSPMKQTAGTTENNTSSSFTTDSSVLETAESLSPSTVTCEDSGVSNSGMICEVDTAITPSRYSLEDDESSVDMLIEDSISSSQKTFTEETSDTVKTNKLAVYAYKPSERSYLLMISGYNKSSFSDNSDSSTDSLLGNNSTLSRKLNISEDAVCPVKQKKLKPSTNTPSTEQELSVQKMPDEISSSSSRVDACDVVDLTVSQPTKKVTCPL